MANVTPPVVTANGTPLDPSNVILPLVIRHGRSGTDTQPDAPSCTFTWRGASTPFTRGDPIVVDLDLPVAGSHAAWGDPVVQWTDLGHTWSGAPIGTVRRFSGVVVAIQAREDDGDVTEWTVNAVGIQNRLGYVNIRTTRPAETDVERVAAICATAGVPFAVFGSDTVDLLPDEINRDALSAVHEICSWSGGMLFNGKDGTLYYGTAQHRDTDAAAVLAPSAVLDGVAWDTTTADIVNHVVVTYGDPETQNTYQDATSQGRWGFRHVEVSTKLATQVEADEFGNTILVRRKAPFWVMPGVLVRSDVCTDAEYWEANLLSVSMGVLLAVPPEPGPVAGTPDVWTVEGWVETWDRHDMQRLQIAVSDRARWGSYALRRWSDMALDPWSYWAANYSWLTLLTETA